MSHVKLTGDIGWRHNDDKGLLSRLYPGLEVPLFQPELIPLLLDPARVVGFGHFFLYVRSLRHDYLFLVFGIVLEPHPLVPPRYLSFPTLPPSYHPRLSP